MEWTWLNLVAYILIPILTAVRKESAAVFPASAGTGYPL